MDMGMQGALPGEFLDEDPFGRFVQFLKKRGWIVVVTLLVGLLVGIAVNRILPKFWRRSERRYAMHRMSNYGFAVRSATIKFPIEER